MELVNRFFKDYAGSYFLFGPRGTGKSTWLKSTFPDALYLDLLQPDTHRAYQARPERLNTLISGNLDKRTIIIDEIQKIPALLDPIHALMEKQLDLKFIMTGSSSRKLKRTGVDLLAGRAGLHSMHPFTAAELGENFNLQESLVKGLVPVVFNSKDYKESLKAYIELYIKEEVLLEGLVRNIGGFARFLEAISFSHGAVLNVSDVARDCEVERKTVQGFIDIFIDLLLAFFIPVFTKRAKRAVISHPKFYIFDPGVFSSIRPRGPLDRIEEIGGLALEGLVAQHLKAWLDYSRAAFSLYFWRTKAGAEVDFILYGEAGFWAIEVKNANKVHSVDLRSLKTFCTDYPECRPIFLYRGQEKLKIDNILCMPCEEFLKLLTPTFIQDGSFSFS